LFVLFGLGARDFFWCATAALSLVWLTNLYNFMDGSDGLAGGMALLGFSAYGGVAASGDLELSFACWSVAAAVGGFLLFNFPPAKVFMGDAGSIPLGFLAAAVGMLGWQKGLWPLWFPVLVFSPFVVDASFTLLRRMLRGEHFWQAHREHYYQRLIRMGWGHRRTALTEYALMVGVIASALAALRQSQQVQILILAGWSFFYGTMMVLIDTRWRRFLRAAGEDN
jgi:UDP-GlcNAc:undecaprenyl-phosphate/decaprenyl-phosphate GlcNAc-1-phosphate transferase